MTNEEGSPLGFFWDIENCPVPKSKSGVQCVQALRNKFAHLGSEVEFVAVCDVFKQRGELIDQLNLSQVSVVHVSSICKNAADEKLKSYLRRFGSTYKSPGYVILITSDVNFAQDLSDLRNRLGFYTTLVHQPHVSEALVTCVQSAYSYKNILASVPDDFFSPMKPEGECILRVSNLPTHMTRCRVQARLDRLMDNCGGRIHTFNRFGGNAQLRFANYEAAKR